MKNILIFLSKIFSNLFSVIKLIQDKSFIIKLFSILDKILFLIILVNSFSKGFLLSSNIKQFVDDIILIIKTQKGMNEIGFGSNNLLIFSFFTIFNKYCILS